MLSKYLNVIVQTFYSIQGLEQVLQTHLKKLRARALKKSLCGLLENVLLN